MARVYFIGLLVILSCTRPKDKPGLRFTLLSPSATGIAFNNTITESDSLNMFVDEYTYMGGGVGVGDFNRDGLPDLFFAGSQVSSRLYLNKGNCRFEDITAKAHLSTNAWCTGVAVVDINNDGWPDIYVCVSGKAPGLRSSNLLFINQHNLTFKEEAAEYGLADTSCSTRAVFFDYDHDGRPDMYLAAGILFHNEGIPPGKDHPIFKDVSGQAGIVEDRDCYGVAISDFNNDGWPDIYVNNEHGPGDLLWVNNHDGTFTNAIGSALRHQSYSGAGIDVADLDNDGLTDIITLDRPPPPGETRNVRNMLQLNRGTRPDATPFFSEIAEMAGLGQPSGSWSVLIADFDNDGWKDVHITNGRDSLHNYLFHNTGGLLFEDISEGAGITGTGSATGAVYADLDNDGDLDLIT